MKFLLSETLQNESFFVRDLPLSELRLHDQKSVPWLILVPRVEGVFELFQLEREHQVMLMEEITTTSRVLEAIYKPHKLNVAALGNIVAQLHVHIIARFQEDPCWPSPVWGRLEAQPYNIPQERDRVIAQLNAMFDQVQAAR